MTTSDKISVQMTSTRVPELVGPVDDGKGKGIFPFSAADSHPLIGELPDMAAHGYLVEEYFLSGAAQSYEAADGTTFGPESNWAVQPLDVANFNTRMIVSRPQDPAKFNGTAIFVWTNVSAGFELLVIPDESVLEQGFACITLSAQRVGVEGWSAEELQAPQGAMDFGLNLKKWDPERYGELHHPGDAYCYDILRQAARLVQSAGSEGCLGNLEVERVVSAGGSQSALRLVTYINAIHPLDPVFDGFMPYIVPNACGLGDEILSLEDTSALPIIRDDLDVPVMIVNSEWETVRYYPARRPDTDTFCFWEVAGAPHIVIPPNMPSMEGPGRDPNTIDLHPVYAAAWHYLQRWMIDGTPPPGFPPIEVDDTQDPPEIRRDRFGNTMGGIRLPQLAVPVAEYHGLNPDLPAAGPFGWARAFTADELREYYSSADEYAKAYDAAVNASLEAGYVLSADDLPTGDTGRAIVLEALGK